jgi:16S rRNA A1518/A1519 N6-dimethyltransferase RsmA/KsgA/DIM1 with predicted DNA glycosylase/AP lyase activity
VEIGPGLGALTGQLLDADVTVTLIEKDRNMVAWLEEKYSDPRVELFHADALDFDLRKPSVLRLHALDCKIYLGALTRINPCSHAAA